MSFLESHETLRNGALWMGSSIGIATYGNTAFLQAGGTAWQLTLTRFVGSALLGAVQASLSAPRGTALASRLRRPVALLRHRAVPYALPAAMLMVANYLNAVALGRTGITVTYVVKCSIPILTALLCAAGLGPRPPQDPLALLSILVVTLGVGLASSGNAEFRSDGFAAALCSAIAQAGLTISSKRALVSQRLSGPESQFVMATLAAGTLATGSVVRPGGGDKEKEPLTRRQRGRLCALGATAAVGAYLEYSYNFAFIALTSPTFAAVMDAVRRAGIVYAGKVMFRGEPLLPKNVLGIAMAVVGGACFTLALAVRG